MGHIAIDPEYAFSLPCLPLPCEGAVNGIPEVLNHVYVLMLASRRVWEEGRMDKRLKGKLVPD